MIRRALCLVAGVDRHILADCPATDRLWATQIGFSLLISFSVVLSIAFYATGYMVDGIWLRLLVSTLIALTVFMFDRALYQSDWFLQAPFQAAALDEYGAAPQRGLRRFLRIFIRLGISIVLAWIIAVFLELAIFSDTINERIKRDYLAANQGVFEKLVGLEAQVDAGIAQRRATLASLEALYNREAAVPPAPPPQQMIDAIAQNERRLNALDERVQKLRAELREIETQVIRYSEEMAAEQLGLKLRPDQSGRPGEGPRYRFASQQRDIQEQLRDVRTRELEQLLVERNDLRNERSRLKLEISSPAGQARMDLRREALLSQVERARAELSALEAARGATIAAFRQELFASSEYQPQRNDPLARMTAYQALKADPTDGNTIILFSWMTKALVIFLEIAPILAKMFFAPPSVYAAIVQAQVSEGRRQAFLEESSPLDFKQLAPLAPSAATPADATRPTVQSGREPLPEPRLPSLIKK